MTVGKYGTQYVIDRMYPLHAGFLGSLGSILEMSTLLNTDRIFYHRSMHPTGELFCRKSAHQWGAAYLIKRLEHPGFSESDLPKIMIGYCLRVGDPSDKYIVSNIFSKGFTSLLCHADTDLTLPYPIIHFSLSQEVRWGLSVFSKNIDISHDYREVASRSMHYIRSLEYLNMGYDALDSEFVIDKDFDGIIQRLFFRALRGEHVSEECLDYGVPLVFSRYFDIITVSSGG